MYNKDEPRDSEGKWTTGGAQAKMDAARSKSGKATSSHKPSTKAKQDLATDAEKKIIKMLGGKGTGDNKPVDVVLERDGRVYGIEVKSISDNGNNKITMHKESLERKVKWGRSNHASLHTVVVDSRSGTVLYRKGVGSFRIHTMTVVNNNVHLQALVLGRGR